MRPLFRISAILNAMLALGAICSPQTDPKNAPQPPTAELKKFDPFLGKYQVSGDFANLPWTGTLELKKAIKDWYIEQTILIKTQGIDREFRILATWDKNLQKYRLWGFQTLPIMPDDGGEVRFEGDEMITEWVSARPDGSQARYSNRYRFVSKDELEILSYRQVGNGSAEKIGFLKGKRMLNAEEASASTPSYTPANSAQPATEMQSLEEAFEGTWSIDEKFEPSESMPNGRTGHATQIWRRGPGGFTFMEEFRDDSPSGEFGLALMWWDKTKGFKNTGMWCDKTIPKSCMVFVNDPSASFQWDGKQQVINNEFRRNGKTYSYHEVLTDITQTSFLQTVDIGEKGRPLKRFLTIHATRITTQSQLPRQVSKQDVAAASPEMQRLFGAFQGRWSYRVDRQNGESGIGEQIWRAGPGGVELIEELKGANAGPYGLSVTWWDAVDKGYRAIWCDNTLPTACIVMSKLAQWEGSDFVLRDEFERDGKKFDYKEIVSDITPTSYTQTIYQGETGGELKRMLTIHATRVTGPVSGKAIYQQLLGRLLRKWRNACGNSHDVIDLDLCGPLADEGLRHALELAHVKSQIRNVNIVAYLVHLRRKQDSAHRTAVVQSIKVAELGDRLARVVEYHDLIGLVCNHPQPAFLVEEHTVWAIHTIGKNLRLTCFPVYNRYPDDLVIPSVPHKQRGFAAIKRKAVRTDRWNTVGN